MFRSENDAAALRQMDELEKSFDEFYALGKEMAQAYIDEGLEAGTPAQPEKALWSRRREPNTISCFRGTIPDGY